MIAHMIEIQLSYNFQSCVQLMTSNGTSSYSLMNICPQKEVNRHNHDSAYDKNTAISYIFRSCVQLMASNETSSHSLMNILPQKTLCQNYFSIVTHSLKKTEVLYQPSPRVAYSPPHISIDGTNLNAVEHFTYLDSVISSDTTVSKDLDNRLSKASSSFGRLSKRVWQSHSLRLSTKLQVYRAVVVPTLLYGAETWVLYRKQIRLLGDFTNAACAPSLASTGKTTCRTKKSSR